MNVYQPNDAAAIAISSNQKAPYLGYMPHEGEIFNLTQRYGPELLSQYVVEHCYEASSTSLASKWPVFF